MLIDWFTVLAQAVNFLILVYLLKRWLYKPILKAIDDREKRIAAQLQAAAAQKQQADEQRQKYTQLKEELNKNKDSLLTSAKEEAETEHQRLLEEARKEYDGLRTRLKESLEKEQLSMSRDIQQQVGREIFEIARKVLKDLADTSLEEQIIRVFIQKIAELPPDEKANYQHLRPSGAPLLIQSTFELNAAQKAAIEQVIAELFEQKKTELEFQVVAEEIGGITLLANGFKTGWNIDDYLVSLEKQLSGLTDELPTKMNVPQNSRHED